MTVQAFIEKAIEGGYRTSTVQKHIEDPQKGIRMAYLINMELESMVLDPLAWQAVGKALGNKDEMRCDSPKCDTVQCEYAGYWDWKRKMVGLMESIVYSDMTIEEFLATL